MQQHPSEPRDAPSPTALSSGPTAGEPAVPTGSKPALVGRDGRLALVVGAADLLFWPVVRAIPSSSNTVVAITTFVSLFLVLLFTGRMARAMRSPRAVAVNLALSLLVVLPSILVPVLVHLFPSWPLWGGLFPYWKRYVAVFRGVSGLDMLALIWMAASLGTLLSRLVREFKLLLPMGVALALVDLYTVSSGVVATAVSGTNSLAKTAMSALTVQLPTLQPKNGAAPFTLRIGFADFLFIALFFACFARFDIPARRTFQVLFFTLFLYMAVVFLSGIALPALVPIAVVVIGMNWRRFRYERSEAFALLYAGLLLSGALAYLTLRSRHG